MIKRLDRVMVTSVLICLVWLHGPWAANSDAQEKKQDVPGTMTTVIVLRHADRNPNEVDLNIAGRARAAELIHFAGPAGVKALYWSGVQRTWDTVKPLADCLGIRQSAPYGEDWARLSNEILSVWKGRVVIVVGHGNTVGEIVEAFAGPGSAAQVGTDFDDVTIITLDASRNATVLVLKFGATIGPVGCRK